MAVRTKIDPIARDLRVVVNDLLSPRAQSDAIADFARDQIGSADSTNRRILGRLPPRTITVDGTPGAPLSSVDPDGGAIIAEWEIVSDVLQWIGDTLRDRSPVISGKYRDGHTLFADGVEVERGGQIPQAGVYTFINLEPYARKIEVGKTESGRDFVVTVPNRIYERTARDAKARFGNTAKISFGYESQIGAYTLKRDNSKRRWDARKNSWRYSAKQSPDRVAGSVVTAPAIVVSLK